MVRSPVVLVDKEERPDMHRLVERIYLLSSVVVLVRVVHQPVVVAVRDVQRQTGDVPKQNVQIRIVRWRCVGVEQDDSVREVPVRDARNVYAERGELLGQDGTRR